MAGYCVCCRPQLLQSDEVCRSGQNTTFCRVVQLPGYVTTFPASVRSKRMPLLLFTAWSSTRLPPAPSTPTSRRCNCATKMQPVRLRTHTHAYCLHIAKQHFKLNDIILNRTVLWVWKKGEEYLNGVCNQITKLNDSLTQQKTANKLFK